MSSVLVTCSTGRVASQRPRSSIASGATRDRWSGSRRGHVPRDSLRDAHEHRGWPDPLHDHPESQADLPGEYRSGRHHTDGGQVFVHAEQNRGRADEDQRDFPGDSSASDVPRLWRTKVWLTLQQNRKNHPLGETATSPRDVARSCSATQCSQTATLASGVITEGIMEGI